MVILIGILGELINFTAFSNTTEYLCFSEGIQNNIFLNMYDFQILLKRIFTKK